MYKKIGLFLRQLREERRWSRRELRDHIFIAYGETITERTIANIEGGENATISSLMYILGALEDIPKDEMGDFLVGILKSGLYDVE